MVCVLDNSNRVIYKLLCSLSRYNAQKARARQHAIFKERAHLVNASKRGGEYALIITRAQAAKLFNG